MQCPTLNTVPEHHDTTEELCFDFIASHLCLLVAAARGHSGVKCRSGGSGSASCSCTSPTRFRLTAGIWGLYCAVFVQVSLPVSLHLSAVVWNLKRSMSWKNTAIFWWRCTRVAYKSLAFIVPSAQYLKLEGSSRCYGHTCLCSSGLLCSLCVSRKCWAKISVLLWLWCWLAGLKAAFTDHHLLKIMTEVIFLTKVLFLLKSSYFQSLLKNLKKWLRPLI